MGFGRACAPVRCAHPSFWAHSPNGALRAPPRPSQLRCFLFDLQIDTKSTKYLHMKSTKLCLASSKILIPQPLSTQRVCPPPAPKAGGYTLAGKWGSGRSIFWKTPDTGLASYSIISLRYNLSNLGRPRQWLFFFPLFLFIHIFLYFSSYLFLFFLFFTYYSSSSYSSFLIFESVCCITDMQGAKPFLIHLWPKYILVRPSYSSVHISSYSSLLIFSYSSRTIFFFFLFLYYRHAY